MQNFMLLEEKTSELGGGRGKIRPPLRFWSVFKSPVKIGLTILSSPFKGRNIVNLDFVYKQLPDGYKACKATLSLT